VSAPFDYVLHVVGLGAAFKVVGVDAGSVVALVPDYGGPVEVGEVERDAVGGAVFAEDVYLSVAVASPGALPFPAGVGWADCYAGPKPCGGDVRDVHGCPQVFPLSVGNLAGAFPVSDHFRVV
jgi:hypothetical protein